MSFPEMVDSFSKKVDCTQLIITLPLSALPNEQLNSFHFAFA